MEDLFRGVETNSVRDSFKSQCHFLHFGSGDAHKSFAALSLSPLLHSQHFPSRLHHHKKTSAFEVSFSCSIVKHTTQVRLEVLSVLERKLELMIT